ncbi:hypothetical protein EMCRGX_G021117 [Ephydatia muelleri]|eukprot:Em0016g999a
MDNHTVPTGREGEQWNPYSLTGGTLLAIAGDDFAIIASDTRLSEGFNIHSRKLPKTYQLSDTIVFGCCGFHGDVLTLTKELQNEFKTYEYIHHKKMSLKALAQLLSTKLYYRRFFPFYTSDILAGIDSEGKGCVYSFDPVGSYERETHRSSGTASTMLQPLLDNQIDLKNQKGAKKEPLTLEKAVALVKDVFSAAAERDIYTGDGVKINVIRATGTEVIEVPLRRD